MTARYQVTITRLVEYSVTVEIDADNADSARDVAVAAADNITGPGGWVEGDVAEQTFKIKVLR